MTLKGKAYLCPVVWMLLSVASLFTVAAAETETPTVGREIPADWIETVPVENATEVPLDEVQEGQYYRLLDRQVQVTDDGNVDYYSHFAVEVISASGMEPTSHISITFDPDYQALTFHTLCIRRGDEIIDKLPDTDIQLLRREREMESLIYDGRYTADIILEDVRVGDVIEYAYTVSGDNPIYRNTFSYWIDTDWSVPVQKYEMRLRWPAKHPLYQKRYNTSQVLSEELQGNVRIYSLALTDVPAYRTNTETPDWYESFGYIQVSETRSWSEVIDWGIPLYRVAYEKDDDILSIAEETASADATPKENTMRALSRVQNDIRYLGIEMGVNSHQPSPPAETFRRRYGDCKDKTVALVSLLTAMGIEAYPALVGTGLEHTIESYLPTVHAFDHVIVCAIVEGQTYWLDPTLKYQGNNLDRVYQPDYGVALVIRPGGSELTQMPDNGEMVGFSSEETFDLRGDPAEAVSYQVETFYKGLNAEYMRYWLAEDGKASLEEDYLNYYTRYYEQIEGEGTVDVVDAPDTNELMLRENYRIENFWDSSEGDRWCMFYSNAIYDYLVKPDQRQRHEPFAIEYPVNVHQTIQILLPEDAWDIEADSFAEENAHFRYTSDISYDSNNHVVTLEYRYQSLKDNVAPEALTGYMEAIDRVEDDLDFIMTQPAGAESPLSAIQLLSWGRIHYYVILVMLLLLAVVYCLAEWHRDSRAHAGEKSLYFPVSLLKLFILHVATFGLYGRYWFYRNWWYVRRRDSSAIMPFWRCIFTPIWFIPLYLDLKRDSLARFGRRMIPATAWAVLLFLLYIGLGVVGRVGGIFSLISMLSAVCLLPFANYILFINQKNSEALRRAAAWRPRHYIVSALAGVMLLYVAGGVLHWIPNGKVLSGKQLPGWEIRFLQRNGVMPGNARLLYFYSDAFLFMKNDGNGVTDKNVFSYWIENGEGIQTRSAAFDEIEDIHIQYPVEKNENTVITIVPESGEDFILYASGDRQKDRLFIKAIEDRMDRSE